MSESSANLSGRWITKAMKQAGLTQKELAERTGIYHGDVSKLCNARRAATLDTIIRLLAACGFEIVELRVKRVVTIPHKIQQSLDSK